MTRSLEVTTRRGILAGLALVTVGMWAGCDMKDQVAEAKRRAAEMEAQSKRAAEVKVESDDSKLLEIKHEHFALAPDGQHGVSSSNSTRYYSGGGSINVYEVPPVTGRRVVVNGGGPIWSPDGKLLAYWHNGVCLVSPCGRIHKRLTKAEAWPTWMSWSPDGRYIVYMDKDQGFFTVSADGRQCFDLSSGNALPSLGCWLEIDGQPGLLHTRHIKVDGRTTWWMIWMRADGAVCKALMETAPKANKDRMTGWAISRRWFDDKVLSVTKTSTGSAALLDLEAKQLTVYDPAGDSAFPSPDRKWIAHKKLEGLFISRTDGSRRIHLGRRGDVRGWSSDGKSVYVFVPSVGTGWSQGELVAIDWQRKVRRPILHPCLVGAPEVEDGWQKIRFRLELGPENWGGKGSQCWLSLADSPPVIHVLWPRPATIRFQEPPPEESVAAEVVDVESPGEPEVIQFRWVGVDLSRKPVPTENKDLPSQVFELGAN